MKYLAFTLSPAVPRSITGRYKNNIGKKTALQSSSPAVSRNIAGRYKTV